jgi:hypothetical protein
MRSGHEKGSREGKRARELREGVLGVLGAEQHTLKRHTRNAGKKEEKRGKPSVRTNAVSKS